MTPQKITFQSGKLSVPDCPIIPFIEGYGHLGDWEQVKTLTKSAKRITAGLEPSLCSTLDRLALDTPASQERDDTLMKLKDDLNCSNYQ